MNDIIVRVVNLSHRYGGSQWAIKDINFEINKNGIMGLLGSNGAGKSTTMNIVCGALNPTKGEIFINGFDLSKNPEIAKRFLGFLPQKPPLYMDMTVKEYLTFAAYLRYVPESEIKKSVEEVMDKCGIAHFHNRIIRNLSGGYQQRVGIAQSIVHKPLFVVFDEPTNGLDPNQIIEVRKLIKEIAKERAILLSTHILAEVQAVCDNIRMIEHGKMVFEGTLRDFDNVIIPTSFFIALENPPELSRLSSIPQIKRVDVLGDSRFRLHYEGNQNIVHDIVRMSVGENWGLTHLSLDKSSLDEVFAKLSNKKN